MGPVHSMELDRLVTVREAMTATGFSVYHEIASASRLLQVLSDDFLDMGVAMSSLGNAMHQANCSVVLALTMAATRPINKYEISFRKHVADRRGRD